MDSQHPTLPSIPKGLTVGCALQNAFVLGLPFIPTVEWSDLIFSLLWLNYSKGLNILLIPI